MKEMKFKVLIKDGQLVGVSPMGEMGIYPTPKPTLHWADETIESLIQCGREDQAANGECFWPESYFENLKKCQLVDCVLTING